MKENPRELLDAAARTRVPDNLNLFPGTLAQLERKTFMQTLRVKPALLILSVLLALALLTGVAYAVGRTLGYIPGVGIVEQGAPIRVLAEPITVTRDGITLTVTEAVLTAEKTIVIYTLENIPWSAYSHDENVSGCPGTADLRLPNGDILKLVDGGGTSGKNRFDYPAIPMNVNEAAFLLPCISGTLPGLAPENWELSLRFKPAPPDMTVVPVVEIVPTPTVAPASVPVTLTTIPAPLPVELTKALQIGDLYVLTGVLHQPEPASGGWVELTGFHLTDANGAEIYTEPPQMPDLPNFDWGAQFKAEGVQFPVTLTFSGVRISSAPGSSAEFEFDAGTNPQPGQEWEVNQPIQIGGRTVTLKTVRVDHDGYSFHFTCDPDVTMLTLEIPGYTASGGGGGGSLGLGQFQIGVAYAQLPTGKLKVALSNLTIASPPETWTIQWSPDNSPSAAQSLYGIALKLDKFIPIEDGYYLIGQTTWTDERITGASPAIVNAWDASGKELMLESADWQAAGLMPENDTQWIFKIYGKAFTAPVSLRAAQMSVTFKNPVRLALDLRNYGFKFDEQHLNMPYKTGLIPLDVPGILAQAFKATYVRQGDLRGFEIAIQADSALQGLGFSIESGQNTTGMDRIAGDGGSNRDETSGLVLSTTLTNAPLSFPIGLRADGAVITGKWETTWTPP